MRIIKKIAYIMLDISFIPVENDLFLNSLKIHIAQYLNLKNGKNFAHSIPQFKMSIFFHSFIEQKMILPIFKKIQNCQ